MSGIRPSVQPLCPLCLCGESSSPHTQVKSVPRFRFALSLLLCLSLLAGGGCFETEESEPFYGQVTVPRAQEFRWSDGGLPRVFDPARAAAPPDTDAVRALFEGLTEYEPGTVRPAPAVASRWESHEDGRVWTFHLRPGVTFQDGTPLDAEAARASFERLLTLGLAPSTVLARFIDEPAQISAPDSRTLLFDLERPQPLFEAAIAAPVGAALELSARLVATGEHVFESGVAVRVDLAATERRLAVRLAEAVETHPPPRRGRPPTVRIPPRAGARD